MSDDPMKELDLKAKVKFLEGAFIRLRAQHAELKRLVRDAAWVECVYKGRHHTALCVREDCPVPRILEICGESDDRPE